MVQLHWDHTIQFTNNLDDAIALFGTYGLIAAKGGKHKQWGTSNALLYFDLSYIEFLNIFDWDLAKQAEPGNRVTYDAVRYLPQEQRLNFVAIRSTNIQENYDEFKEKGLPVGPLMDGKRLDTQGKLIEWKMFTIDKDTDGVAYPFFIQWQGADAERIVSLKSSGVIKKHPSGNANVKAAVFNVSNPEKVAAAWSDLLHLEVESGEGKPVIRIADKKFIFEKGNENRLDRLIIETDSEELKGTHLSIGYGNYYFI